MSIGIAEISSVIKKNLNKLGKWMKTVKHGLWRAQTNRRKVKLFEQGLR